MSVVLVLKPILLSVLNPLTACFVCFQIVLFSLKICHLLYAEPFQTISIENTFQITGQRLRLKTLEQ